MHIVDLTGRENVICRKFAMSMAIGVEERKRRQGFGTALVEHMWQWLSSEEIKMVQLNVATRNQTEGIL
ncbi:GNAT superfamily N-acetyltransferase [Phyllobacterium ifriqiyense]